MSGEARPTGHGETGSKKVAGGNSKSIVPNSRKIADWLGIATWQIPELRTVRTDRHYDSHQMLYALMVNRPGNVERGGGRQTLDDRPDGEWLWAAWMFGRLEADKRRGGRPRNDDPHGWAAWRYGKQPSTVVLPYANAFAEAEAAWHGATITVLARLKADRPHRAGWTSATCCDGHSIDRAARHGHDGGRRRLPLSALFSCERIPRKPMKPFLMGVAA